MSKTALPQPWPESPGLREAIAALAAKRGPVPPHYVPPNSTFPMTPAAAVAKRLSREK